MAIGSKAKDLQSYARKITMVTSSLDKASAMITFEAGKTYATRSICDHDAIIEISVATRTAKTLTTREGKRLGIGSHEGVEQVRPLGHYSMAPLVRANGATA